MVQTIGVLGANGVYARHLIPRLLNAGNKVRALARRPEAASLALACGADVVQADIFDESSMAKALEGCAIGINLATALPGPSGRGNFEANDELRRHGTANWLAACKQAGVARIIQQSIAMVNASASAQWSDEDHIYQSTADTVASRAIAASLAMETSVSESTLDWLILRGGLFYGPGTGFDDAWYSMAAAGKLKLPGDGTDYVSLVHIADMASATLAALSRWPHRSKLIVCDDQPAQWRDIFAFIAEASGHGAPKTGGQLGFPSFRLHNTKAREMLTWTPFYATYREGLAR